MFDEIVKKDCPPITKSTKTIRPGSYESINFGTPPDDFFDEPTHLEMDHEELMDFGL